MRESKLTEFERIQLERARDAHQYMKRLERGIYRDAAPKKQFKRRMEPQGLPDAYEDQLTEEEKAR